MASGSYLQPHQVQRIRWVCGWLLFIHQRNAAGPQQAFGLRLFAAEADHHYLAAKVGVLADVAQRADVHHRVGSVDAYAVNSAWPRVQARA